MLFFGDSRVFGSRIKRGAIVSRCFFSCPIELLWLAGGILDPGWTIDHELLVGMVATCCEIVI